SDISSLEFIVDVNPNKWGLYIPGSGQQVISPDSLKDYQPDVILIMNPNYYQEISTQLNSMGLAPKLLVTTSTRYERDVRNPFCRDVVVCEETEPTGLRQAESGEGRGS